MIGTASALAIDIAIPTIDPERLEISIGMAVLLVLVLSLVVATILRLVGSWLVGMAQRTEEQTFAQAVLEETTAPVYVTVFLFGVFLSVELLAHAEVEIADVSIEGLTGLTAGLLVSTVIVVWVYAVVKIGDRFVDVLMAREESFEFAPIANTVFKIVVITAGFFALLGVWGVDVTPFIASAGVLGIIIGIAAQDTIGNLFAGVTLSFDKTYKVGDVLTLSTGERGTVTNITFRSTTIRTRDDVEVTIPNAEIANSRITNETAPRRRRRIRLDVGVAYDSDLEAVRETLLSVAEEESMVLEDPSPSVEAREFGDSAIDVQLKVYIRHPILRGRVTDRLIRRTHVRFREEGITIPFPQRTVSYLEPETTAPDADLTGHDGTSPLEFDDEEPPGHRDLLPGDDPRHGDGE